MRSDGAETRELLVRTAQRLFATRGLGVSSLEIREAAGQRNRNAISYYFGSRDGLVTEVVDHHARALNASRRAMLDRLSEPTLADYVSVLVIPLSDCLKTTEGRYHLLVVQQLVHHLGRDSGDLVVDPALAETLAGIRRGVSGRRSKRGDEQALLASTIAAAAMASRARQIEEGRPLALGHRPYVDLVIETITTSLTSKP